MYLVVDDKICRVYFNLSKNIKDATLFSKKDSFYFHFSMASLENLNLYCRK